MTHVKAPCRNTGLASLQPAPCKLSRRPGCLPRPWPQPQEAQQEAPWPQPQEAQQAPWVPAQTLALTPGSSAGGALAPTPGSSAGGALGACPDPGPNPRKTTQNDTSFCVFLRKPTLLWHAQMLLISAPKSTPPAQTSQHQI
eukprot:1144434-Pelagomonas_calceolata.AAC.7